MASEPECICCFLASDPYKCRKCWPEGGSAAERKTFFDIVEAERNRVLEQEEKERQERNKSNGTGKGPAAAATSVVKVVEKKLAFN